ncbi:MAG: aminopeptidase [Bacteroidales bacterium]|nr:aminopeptidase [Bacteroidales bacterium]MDE7128506.1 aminopeptidase [Bacteroidales bacterium]
MNNIRMFIMAAAATAAAAVPSWAQGQEKDGKASEYEFTVVKEVPVTSIKNQYRSGTCWCFSALSFVESEILRTKGLEDIDLSEMFVVGKSYHDRAVKYVRLDGKLGFSAGSSFGDVFHVIKDYGIVPQCEMEGLNYGTEKPEHSEMDAVLAAYVEAVAKNPNKKLTPAWIKGYDGIISAYLGEYPQEFEYNGAAYTPESFRDYLGINTDDYVNLTSFTHHPFYEPFVIEVCDNWRWDTAYNLPIDEFMEVMYNAIDKGYSIAWGSDVSEAGFTRNGLATIPDVDEKPGAGSDQEHWVGKDESAKPQQPATSVEKKITQEMRQIAYDNKQTTDDHGMHIYGVAQDQNGNKFFIVKNSWGDAGKYKGVWYASDAFVRYKTLNIVVHKDALPKNIKKKLGIK